MTSDQSRRFPRNLYDPRNGKELWHVTRTAKVFKCAQTSLRRWPRVHLHRLSASESSDVSLDGKGDVTKSKVQWKLDRGVPLTPSPLLVGNELYLVTDNGIVLVWMQRQARSIGACGLGNHSASPIFADGRIYFLSEEGQTVVLAPGQQLKHLGTNQLDGRTLASMAVSNGSIFIRSETHLYRLGK